MQVELVKARTEDGVSLDGSLRKPSDGGASQLSFDAVIMHHGVGGNFYTAHFYDQMATRLLEKNCAVIRVNNRGHDLAFNAPPPHNRLGAAFEIIDDCRQDWKAWLDLASDRGYERICVWGHSLGAVKNIYYLAQETDVRITCGIASSPPRFSQSAFLARPDGHLFGDSMRLAQRLDEEGKADFIFPIQVPTAAMMTCRTFFDKYGSDERYDVLKHVPEIDLPLLVTIGGLEGAEPDSPAAFAFAGLADKLETLAENSPNMSFQMIADADHFYRGQTDALWNAVDNWLDG